MRDVANNQVLQAIKELQDQMNAGFEKVNNRFEQVDKRFEAIEKRLDQMDTKIDGVQDGVDLLAKRTWNNEKDIHIMKRRMGLE
ncbi:hypothetical protein [Lentibacillus salinarum]|uniref:t-SNARE coiled-coil homology domain-containing protein n=1 Tax=Lentibacillus salinarum TaxID=446820 RepID=A0ABW3ZQC5_9BACI